MTPAIIAARLIELCSKGEFIRAQQELYHPEIVSIDPDGSLTNGAANMHAKEQRFLDNLFKIHQITYSEPQFAGNYFSVVLGMDIETKAHERRSFQEVCVYQVNNGKIVFEQFFRDLVKVKQP